MRASARIVANQHTQCVRPLATATPAVSICATPRSEQRLCDLQTLVGADNLALECKGASEAVAFMGRIRVLGVIGSGLGGVVLRCTMDGSQPSCLFALKLEPVFRNASLNSSTQRLEESDANNMSRREMMTATLLNSIAAHETRVLQRPYSEMTYHTVRALQWGTLRMSPYTLLKGIAGVTMAPATRAFLQQSRTWSYMVMELASGGSSVNLLTYARRLADTISVPDALERFLAGMYVQLAAQLLILSTQRKMRHNDMHLDNVCWIHETPEKRIYYELPGGVRLLVPLADTVPCGALAGLPSEHGALVFKIIDWGLASAETPYVDDRGKQITLCYGPTHTTGGEYDDAQFYGRFDFAHLLTTVNTQLGRALPHRVRDVLDFVRARQRDNTLACIAAEYPTASIACNGTTVRPSATPPPVDGDFAHRLFALPLFDRYRTHRPPAELLDANTIPVRVAPHPSTGGLTQRAIQNETLRVDVQPIVNVSGMYRAKLSARTL